MSIVSRKNLQDGDFMDRAAALSRHLADSQIAAVRQLAAPEQRQNEDGSWPVTECVDCDADLGERMKLARIRCIECQEEVERRSALWRR